ncbi:hypothetical protein GCM10007320_29610 [Pseudorhodoferax aquiterrae]|uniref:Uncharacterized protein n=1 Tax=Pseudorhodoferax aquiterrae TaxID=747304 RepID=A0ABQ3G445_9BURK|nr:hypothetical protein GCM10007320_29610 [Pseudorhodoferax aquiterrae]
MQTTIPPHHLQACVQALARADASDEMRPLACDLLTRLIRLNDTGRLSRDVLMLALDSLALVPELESHLEPLRIHAGTSKPADLG